VGKRRRRERKASLAEDEVEEVKKQESTGSVDAAVGSWTLVQGEEGREGCGWRVRHCSHHLPDQYHSHNHSDR